MCLEKQEHTHTHTHNKAFEKRPWQSSPNTHTHTHTYATHLELEKQCRKHNSSSIGGKSDAIGVVFESRNGLKDGTECSSIGAV